MPQMQPMSWLLLSALVYGILVFYLVMVYFFFGGSSQFFKKLDCKEGVTGYWVKF